MFHCEVVVIVVRVPNCFEQLYMVSGVFYGAQGVLRIKTNLKTSDSPCELFWSYLQPLIALLQPRQECTFV